jgi:hypothetical protein
VERSAELTDRDAVQDVLPFFRNLKNEAKQKPRFLLCVLKKTMDGLFQHRIIAAHHNQIQMPAQFHPPQTDEPIHFIGLYECSESWY